MMIRVFCFWRKTVPGAVKKHIDSPSKGPPLGIERGSLGRCWGCSPMEALGRP